jgi:hypothetical protein
MDEGIMKMWQIYTMEFYAGTKKKKMKSLARKWVELRIITLSEINQSHKDKYHISSHL